uniref:Uncharacterized protein n=1 Tax=Panagrolaimus sp. JU765 TaxID=591449 RepID=A0AC34RFI5_9BILA
MKWFCCCLLLVLLSFFMAEITFAQVFPRGTTFQTDYDTQLTQKLKDGYSCMINQTWDGKPVDHDPIKIKMHWHFERVKGAPHKRVIVVEFTAPLFDDPEPDFPPGPTPGLWNYEVVELFFANNEGHYLEVEVGPHGHWLLLFHKGYRDCFNSGEDVDIEVENNFDMNTWHCRFEIPLAFFPAKVTKFNAYAIHGVNSERQYEALHPVTDGGLKEPDFHKLEYFKKIDTLRFIPETYNNQVFVDAKFGNMWSVVAPDDDEVEAKRPKREDDWD